MQITSNHTHIMFIEFISSRKVLVDGKSQSKFDLAHLIDKIRIIGFVNPDAFTKDELVSILKLSILSHPIRVNRLSISTNIDI